MSSILALIGCGADMTGIWAMIVPYNPDTTECATAITENYDGHEPDDGGSTSGGDWTYTEEFTGADALMFFQIIASGDGKATFFAGNLAFPGTWNADQWEFVWARTTDETSIAKNDNDYGFAQVDETNETTTIAFKPLTGETAEGNVDDSSVNSSHWEETDEWDNDDVQTDNDGNTPVGTYLTKQDEDDNNVSQRNDSEDDDCDGNTCTLTVETTCASSGDFTAERVKTDDQDAYDYVMSHGQSGGGSSGGGGGIDTGNGGGNDSGW